MYVTVDIRAPCVDAVGLAPFTCGLGLVGHLEHLGDLLENPLPLSGVPALDRGRDTGIQVIVEDLRAYLVQGRADGLYLPNNVYAVFILLDHADDSAEVTFYGFEPTEGNVRVFQRVLLEAPFYGVSCTPTPRGVGTPYDSATLDACQGRKSPAWPHGFPCDAVVHPCG